MTHKLITRHPIALTAASVLLGSASLSAYATNGMLMEGYGPEATSMGGASMAYDNGTAAVINNPATLGLGKNGTRLDFALGLLGPNVSTSAGPMTTDSSGNSYVMPAFGFANRTKDITYGFAVFAQGGMGTEYSSTSFLAMGSGAPVRSELAVGRAMIPLAYQVSPSFTIGATLDYTWATLDLRMAASGAQLGQMVTGASGNLGMALPALGGAPWARIDFSDDSSFSGKAKGHGWTGKLGAVAKASDSLSIGMTYHAKTRLSDMTTDSTGAQLSATGGFADTGRITVQDFQMPQQFALGMAWQATPALMIAADIKQIQWSGVMDSFRMRYDSAGMGGSVSFALPQQWKDQTVLQVGGAYKVAPGWTARAGLNLANNPVPNTYVNPLFPAIVTNHLTGGFGYAFDGSDIQASMTYAPKVTVQSASGLSISHSQLNLQFMYSYRF